MKKFEIEPLTRITASSKVMLPFYPVFAMLIGLAYAFGDPSRTNIPSFNYPKEIMPVHYWGWIFIALSLFSFIALIFKSRLLMIFMLCTSFGVYLVWSLLFLASVFQVPDASLVAPCLWGTVAYIHIATLQSITKD